MEHINKYLSGVLLPLSLAFFAVFFLIKLKGAPLTHPKTMVMSVFGGGEGERKSSVRAVILALAGTLGVGNIAGVASAIALGGAGAVLWMWISALLAMILKYSEVVLALVHRRSRNGEYYGGAMYYMRDFFNSRKKYSIGIAYSSIFTLLCLLNGFTMGCMIQSNAISQSLKSSLGIGEKISGAVIAALIFAVLILNGKKIFSFCTRLVPAVSILYIIMSLAVIASEFDRLGNVLREIFADAFSFEAAGAGVFGFFTSRALRFGTVRGLFSNEAGCGTSPIAHATADTSSPARQGILGVIEVFIDTIVVCTMTAFVILLNRDTAFLYRDNPIMMALSSFSALFGRAGALLLSASVVLFAFATIICWGYYGKECVYYLNKGKTAERIYYIVYILLAFFGSFISLEGVWAAADFALGAMSLMNLAVLGAMSGEIKRETLNYFK